MGLLACTTSPVQTELTKESGFRFSSGQMLDFQSDEAQFEIGENNASKLRQAVFLGNFAFHPLSAWLKTKPTSCPILCKTQ
ncbi:hypothetical protein CEXT_804161 [Caerostris extrusa]|uniref:Uncharacterized protein n=1 Tax=Caerostris extrusa TaxID=172846 RepID=A0AAV4N626_CAEEX|nr:hypothetical protein CEXT_804161 [Caerostris extrusa]